MSEKFCRMCGRPVVWAYFPDGALVVVDRQIVMDGDIELTLREDGYLIANSALRGSYRAHSCPGKTTPKISAEERERGVETALTYAEKLSRSRANSGQRAAVIATLAAEVRRQRVATTPEQDAIDAVLAAYRVHIDDLPGAMIQCLEALLAIRKRTYM